MNSSYFTEEHQSFREFKRFLVKEVVPHIEKWEKQVPSNDLYGKFGDMGFFGISYPEAYGGLNLDLFYTVIFLEELKNKIIGLLLQCGLIL
jgi:alkylation response protein AidB-like acyl-CoA dehydrogenase